MKLEINDFFGVEQNLEKILGSFLLFRKGTEQFICANIPAQIILENPENKDYPNIAQFSGVIRFIRGAGFEERALFCERVIALTYSMKPTPVVLKCIQQNPDIIEREVNFLQGEKIGYSVICKLYPEIKKGLGIE